MEALLEFVFLFSIKSLDNWTTGLESTPLKVTLEYCHLLVYKLQSFHALVKPLDSAKTWRFRSYSETMRETGIPVLLPKILLGIQ